MDLFWNGLTERASEHITINRKSQFNKVFDSVLRDIEMEIESGKGAKQGFKKSNSGLMD